MIDNYKFKCGNLAIKNIIMLLMIIRQACFIHQHLNAFKVTHDRIFTDAEFLVWSIILSQENFKASQG